MGCNLSMVVGLAAATADAAPAREKRSIVVHEGGVLGDTRRHYQLYVPSSRASTGMPLVLHLHGQGVTDPMLGDPATTRYDELAKEMGFIMAYPLGLDDYADNDCEVGWNTRGGAHQRGSLAGTCAPKAGQTGQTCCYKSCRTLGLCQSDDAAGFCGWSTCHDDIAFLSSLLSELQSTYSVDPKRVYATGASNGGMLLHRLVAQLPTIFRAIVHVYATPLAGQVAVPAASRKTAVMSLHGRFDTTVPAGGGESADGWFFASEAETLAAWAEVHGCSAHDGAYGEDTRLPLSDRKSVV